MVFNDTTTKLGLVQDCEIKLFGDNGYGRITGDSDMLYQFTAKLNRAQDRFCMLAQTADGRWQYDDTNYTDYAIATTDIVSGQRDYPLALTHLGIEKVLVLPSATSLNYQLIDPIDENDLDAWTYIQNATSNIGRPYRYDKLANSLFLDPVPNYSATAGLKIYYQRGPSYFVYTDTTKVPGFVSTFHGYLALHASYNYASEHSMPVAGGRLRNGAFTGMALAVNDAEKEIITFFNKRDRDDRPIVKGKKILYI